MASFTMPLRVLIEGYTQNETSLNARQRIEKAREKLFDFDYPFFDEGLRKDFETHFIRRFYMREIGFETEGLFKFQLETWLQIEMPYFNKLLESETLSFNPLENVNFKITSNLKNQKDQNDVIDKINDETEQQNEVGTFDSTSNQTTHDEGTSSNTRVSNRDELTNVDTDKTEDTTQNNTVNTTTNTDTDSTDNNFNRLLRAETGDERLAITTDDGNGVIEYASNIEENKTKNVGNETKNETSETTQAQTSDVTSNEKTNATTATDETVTDNGATTNDATNNLTRNDDETKQKDVTKNRVGNEKLASVIETLEDIVREEKGKNGTVSYSKMLTEYRSTFMRIEKDIFEEMSVLFMGTY